MNDRKYNYQVFSSGGLSQKTLSTITIQGGGIYGLSMLGQLDAVLKAGMKPTAIVGTSAGAIISGLIWIGYEPADILAQIQNLLRKRGITNILKKENANYNASELKNLRKSIAVLFALNSAGQSTRRKGLLSTLCKIGEVLVQIYHAHNMQKSIKYLNELGFFDGDGFERWYNSLIVKKINSNLLEVGEKEQFSENRIVSFADILKLDQTLFHESPRPLLLIGLANLSRKDHLFVDSHSSSFEAVPIARCVRASISFPVFFQPVELSFWRDRSTGYLANSKSLLTQLTQKSRETFVDGGAISNFPAWGVLDQVRELLWGGSSANGYIRLRDGEAFARGTEMLESERYRPHRHNAYRPHVHIGLQIDGGLNNHDNADASKSSTPKILEDYESTNWKQLREPEKYWAELFDFLTVSGRSRLETLLIEDRIKQRKARLISISQTVNSTGWNFHSMDFEKLTVKKTSEMFREGFKVGRDQISRYKFDLCSHKYYELLLSDLLSDVDEMLPYRNAESRNTSLVASVSTPVDLGRNQVALQDVFALTDIENIHPREH